MLWETRKNHTRAYIVALSTETKVAKFGKKVIAP